MHTKSTFFRPRAAAVVVPALLATLVAIGLLGAVSGLFQHDGAPLARQVVAERACSRFSYASEREACVRAWLAAERQGRVASR
jgi:hypothetical protein